MTQHEKTEPTPRQPWLHELAVCVDGNTTALSDRTGQIDATGAQGVFVDDRRVVSRLDIQLGDAPSSHVASASRGNRSQFWSSARHLGTPGADPTVEVHRMREVAGGGMTEQVRVVSRGAEPVSGQLVVRLAGDGADISAVKSGLVRTTPLAATALPDGLSWRDGRHVTTVTAQPAPAAVTVGGVGEPSVLVFPVMASPGLDAVVTLRVQTARTTRTSLDADAGSPKVAWTQVRIRADDPRLAPTVTSSFADLQHLLLTDPQDPSDVFTGAGSPWYLTLFGRDSLWAARMMLPFGAEVAAGTLRVLARRQGTAVDGGRAEAPGKIPHEMRRTTYVDPTSGLALPPVYYGTIDATPLWITLLHDAWRWGMPAAEVKELMPNLRAATRWLTEYAAPDEDGLLKYLDETGTGLANQGWKDSGDSIRWRDGSIAQAPIALVEAQGYAVEAAEAAAVLFEAFGEGGGDEMRAWADAMRDRIRDRFWVGNGPTRRPAIAVDGHGRSVDGIASNMGHLLGTGALDADEVDLVAATLTSPQMLGRHGIGTLASDNGGYNPIGYHTGSVWTHDTAICAWGLMREGRRKEAGLVAHSLLASAEQFGYRWPELYAGTGVLDRPAPYPASCRPQAWSAASAAVLLAVALGFEPDAPAGRLVLRPQRPAPFGALTIHGLRFGGHEFGVRCDADGNVEVLDAPQGMSVDIS
jgi:glycogen debranching enzyme